MIRVVPKAMSAEQRAKYEAKVRAPGARWLAENPLPETRPGEPPPPKKRPPSYWREVSDDLADAFHDRCAYTAMWLSHPGEVDHFVSIDEDRSRAYEWENLRYCAGWVNSTKKNVRSTEILDPLTIEDDWFELLLPSQEIRVTDRCPEHLRARALYTLDRLRLNGFNARRYRKEWYELYVKHGASMLSYLDEKAPLIARAIRKQIERDAPAPYPVS